MTGFRDSQATLVVGLVGGSHVINHMYYMLLPPVTVALASDLDVGVGEIGLAIGLLGAVVTGLQLPFGHLSDTKGRTLMLAISLGFGAVGAALTALAPDYPSLLFAQVVMGIGVAAHHPAHYPLLSAATPQKLRGRAFSIHGFGGAIGFALPPFFVAAATVLGLHWRVALGSIAAIGAVYGLGCVTAFRRFVDDDITRASETANADRPWSIGRAAELPRRGLRGLGNLLSSYDIVLLTVLWLFVSMTAWGIKTQTLPLLTGSYGFEASTANALVSAMLVVGAVSMFGGGWLVDRFGTAPVLFAGFGALVAICVPLASGLVPLVAVVGLVLVLAATLDFTRPARATLADRFSTDDSIGKNFGLVTIGASGGAAIAPPVLGYLAEATTVGTTFVAMAGLGVLLLAMTVVVFHVGDLSPMAVARPADD